MMKTRVFIVRHTETIGNVEKRLTGRQDYEITERGQVLIQKLTKELEKIKFDRAYSSTSRRAIKTIEPIVEKQNLKIEESSKEEELESPNQYKILLGLKVYREQIFDFHFWRSDDNKTWTEKWRFREMRTIRDFKMEFQYYGDWIPVGYYKVTR